MPKNDDREPEYMLEDVEVFKVDLVGKAATGDKFLTVRSRNMKKPRVAMDPAYFQQSRFNQNVVEDKKEDIERIVPSQEASVENKRAAQKERSQQYGIDALEGKNENLSYPKGDPTVESLYGDPVNLKYPLGYEDNKVSLERSNNARVRFKQNYEVYSMEKSRKVIHTRIVEAQLRAGASPSYNPDDSLDKLLPSELVSKIEKKTSRNEEDTKEREGTMKIEDVVEKFGTLIDGVVERMDNLTIKFDEKFVKDEEKKVEEESISEKTVERSETDKVLGKLAVVIEQLTKRMDGLGSKVDGACNKVNEIEKQMSTSAIVEEEKSEEEVSRSEKNFWDGVFPKDIVQRWNSKLDC